jgi:hypothetical protein
MPLCGFFLLAVVLWVTTPALAQSARVLEADRLADKLWWILEITKEYQPHFQAHITLEAPDGERLALTFHGESARTLIQHDVIALERKMDLPPEIPEEALGAYVIPRRVKLGKTRWWRERAAHASQELRKGWTLFLLQHSGRGKEL